MRKGYLVVTEEFFEVPDFTDVKDVIEVMASVDAAIKRAQGMSESCVVTKHSVGIIAPVSEDAGPDRFSVRELRVLELLAEGHCDKNIARIMGIAIGTVKTYTKAIYSKLQVRSRTQAAVWWLENVTRLSAPAAMAAAAE